MARREHSRSLASRQVRAGRCQVQLLLAAALSLALGPLRSVAFMVGNKNFDASKYHVARLGDQTWYGGSATFYNFRTGNCGFSEDFLQFIYTAAVPQPRYSDTHTYGIAPFEGAACGQCYKIRCAPVARFGGEVFCRPGSPTIVVTVVDFDAPRSPPWPLNHFDLGAKPFSLIANPKAGIIDVEWQRTPCNHHHAAWKIAGDSNPWYTDIVIEAVSGVGAVVKVYVVEHGKSGWKAAKHMWGCRWSYPGKATPTSRVIAVLGENKGIVYPVHSAR